MVLRLQIALFGIITVTIIFGFFLITAQNHKAVRDAEVVKLPVKRKGFVLLAFQRSGTHWLTSELWQHSCIDFQPEVFYLEPGETKTWDAAKRHAATEIWFREKGADAAELSGFTASFQDYYRKSRVRVHEGAAVTGFNLKYDQGFTEDWDTWLRSFANRTQLHIIWLQRRNLLRIILSAQILSMTGVSSVAAVGQAVPERLKFKVRPGHILYELRRIMDETREVEKRLAQADKLGVPVLRLYYETLKVNIGLAACYLLSSTNCPDRYAPKAGSQVFKKMNTASVREMVSNIRELEEKLNGTEFEWMMSE